MGKVVSNVVAVVGSGSLTCGRRFGRFCVSMRENFVWAASRWRARNMTKELESVEAVLAYHLCTKPIGPSAFAKRENHISVSSPPLDDRSNVAYGY